MRGSSKDDIVDFRSERDTLDALVVGKANRMTNESRLIALISFQAIVTSKHREDHIDDCVQLFGQILTDMISWAALASARNRDERDKVAIIKRHKFCSKSALD
jgi:hypothetical protein